MIASSDKARIYEGVVAHRRFRPVDHRLRYRVFSFLLDLDKLEETGRRLRWFSVNRFNLFSVNVCDHGAAKGERLIDHVRSILREAGIAADGRIFMLAYPRMFGYVFNPLTIYYCHDSEGALAAMLYEVRNTFGGRHSYLIPVDGAAGEIQQETDKRFHVSPFIDMEMRYHFSLSTPGEEVSVTIGVHDKEGLLLNAAFAGKAQALSDQALLKLFFRHPLMTVKVIAGIHWEAVKLMLKGLRLREGGPDPEPAVTVVRPSAEA